MSDQRVITIYSTKGGMKEITTIATTWGELKPEIKKAGYDLANLAATCGTTRNSLDRDDAILQTGDYTIFLRPVKTKSGALTADSKRADVNAVVKEMNEKYGQPFKDHLNSKGNWTRITTPEVVELINSFKPSGKNVGNVVKDVADSKKSSDKPAVAKTEKVKAKEVGNSNDAFAEAREVLEDAGLSSEALAEKSNADEEAARLREKEEKLAREFDNL